MDPYMGGLPLQVEEMRDSAPLLGDGARLRSRMQQDGYLMIRGLLPRDEVMAARTQILRSLDEVGEIDRQRPLDDGVSTGSSTRGQLPDAAAWFRSICEAPSLRRVTHAGSMTAFHERFHAQPVRALDFVWLRIVPPGPATGCHVDNVFMNRGSRKLHTTWTPLGDVALQLGPLAVLEGSHVLPDIREAGEMDVDRPMQQVSGVRPSGIFERTPQQVAGQTGLRWLSADFRAGDVVVFTMWTVHCGLDNRSQDRLRISCDTRYQPASDPVDERWVGPDPVGHGRGYADMAGVARP